MSRNDGDNDDDDDVNDDDDDCDYGDAMMMRMFARSD